MSLLLPLGLLGLLSLAVLFLIYILRPNYQQKNVSSTFVWKLSLKYKKKRLPVSKLRNLLILLCQIIILVAAAFIIAEPNTVTAADSLNRERIIIVDGSASMRLEHDGSTRFDRAIDAARELADDTFDGGGTVSVIFAGTEANIVAQRLKSSGRAALDNGLDSLECTYGVADMSGAMELASELIDNQTDAVISIVTGTNYLPPSPRVTVTNVAVEGEWNAAILDVRTELSNGFYMITVDVACYGVDKDVVLQTRITGANGQPGVTDLPSTNVYCRNDEVFSVVYTIESRNFGANAVPVMLTDDMRLYSFDQIYFRIDEADGYIYDNEYYLYGGTRPVIKVQYSSDMPNNFFSGFLLQLTESVKDRWKIEVSEVSNGRPALSGFDFYIFENKMPSELPKDGVVLMVNPDDELDAGFTVNRRVTLGLGNWTNDDGSELAQGMEHPILRYVDATAMHVSEYIYINEDSIDSEYSTLLYYQGNPVFFVKNEAERKIAVLALNIRMSNLPLCWGFPIMLTNLFEYYFPTMTDSNIYDIYAPITLNSRGESVSVIDMDNSVTEITELPSTFSVNEPGTYTVSQEIISGAIQTELFYARINSDMSNIFRDEAMLDAPVFTEEPEPIYKDLMVIFAAIMVGLLFVEWLLQAHSNSV